MPKSYGDHVQLGAVLRPVYGRLRTDADIATATAWTRHSWRRRAQQLAEARHPPFYREGEAEKTRLPDALSCPVAFVMIYGGKKGHPKPCRLTTACPFCRAREVRRHWLVIDAAFFPAPPGGKRRVRVVDTDHEPSKSSSFTRSVKDVETRVKSPYDLIRRVFTYRVPTVHEVHALTDRRFKGDTAVIKASGLSAWLRSRTRGQPFPSLHRLPRCRALVEAAGPGGGLLEAIHFIHCYMI